MSIDWQPKLAFRRYLGTRNPERALGALMLEVVAIVAVLLAVTAVWLRFGGHTSAQSADPSIVGQWSSTQPQPVAPVHSVLLPNGKVLYWPAYGIGNTPELWDPATGNTVAAPIAAYNIFCSGMSFLANGQVLVAGGDYTTSVGVPNATIYDYLSNSWTEQPDMNAGRWYPTNTTLGNGDILVTGGDVNATVFDTLPQVFQAATNTWRNLTTAQLSLPTYSSMFMTDNGLVFNAGPNQVSRFLNPTGTGAWTVGPTSLFGFRDYGPVVMYSNGKILKIGGFDPPTATAEVIDINAAVPAWAYTQSMHYPRRQANATILPDGTVLVTGGSSGPGFDDSTHPVYPAELWNPATGTWTVMASLSIYRGYHSTAVLLPDGRVFSGGGLYASSEIYSPPYLFLGTRPVITSAPTSVSGGQTFFVATPDAASITAVTAISLGSTTHTLNQGQTFNQLVFSQANGGLNVTPPANANMAPPGPYMLFLLNSSGIPSTAAIFSMSYSSAIQSSLSLSQSNMNFVTPTLVGSASTAQSVNLTNLGSTAVSINSLTFSGHDFSVSTSTCGSSLAPNSTCQISIVEQPKVSGPLNETLSISDSDPSSPQVLALTGTGKGLSASPTGTTTFATYALGTTSPAKPVTLSNVGTVGITINGLTYSNPEFSNNTATSTCGTSLAAGANCTINVVFTPNATGAQSGTLSISTSDPGSPTVVKLEGNVTTNQTGFSIAPAGGSSSASATVTAGQTATYSLNVSGAGGFSGAVNFACSGAPANSSCSVSPNPLNVSGTTPAAVTVSVVTQAANTTAWRYFYRLKPFDGGRYLAGAEIALSLLIFFAMGQTQAASRWRRSYVLRALALVILATSYAGCGGSGASSMPTPTGGTATGQYTIKITATSGATSQVVSLNLTVK